MAEVFRDRATGQQCRLVAFHDRDAALVRDERGVVRHILLSELDPLDLASAPAAPRPGMPENPKRFDRWSDSEGGQWIFDQPRNPDGSYVADLPETESVESALRWYPCSGDAPVEAEDRSPEQEQPQEG